MGLTISDIDALIDAKVALLQNIILSITDVLDNKKPSYNIDGQQIDWNGYYAHLVDSQNKEIESLFKLKELKNIVEPYQYVSRAY